MWKPLSKHRLTPVALARYMEFPTAVRPDKIMRAQQSRIWMATRLHPARTHASRAISCRGNVLHADHRARSVGRSFGHGQRLRFWKRGKAWPDSPAFRRSGAQSRVFTWAASEHRAGLWRKKRGLRCHPIRASIICLSGSVGLAALVQACGAPNIVPVR